jgi:type III secretion system-like peptide-binding chaperone
MIRYAPGASTWYDGTSSKPCRSVDEKKEVDVNDAAKHSCRLIESALGKSPAFRRVERGLYVIRQGSAYVTIEVISGRKGAVVVRFVAPLVHGVRINRDLAVALLTLNAQLRFGAFGYVPAGRAVTLSHTILGGLTLDAPEVVATLRDMALLADEYDDKIVRQGGGMRMQDMVEDEALANITRSLEDRKAVPN